MDRHFEPSDGSCAEDALGTLTPEIEQLPLPSRARRILRLAAPSFLAWPRALWSHPCLHRTPGIGTGEAPWLVDVPEYLQQLTGVPVDSSAACSCRGAGRPR